MNIRVAKTAVAGLVMSLAMLLAATPQMRADDDDRSHCQHAVERAEARLNHAIEKRGEQSREAQDRRRDLYAERERCWGKYHQWWNGREHRWETEHNWDADDHR